MARSKPPAKSVPAPPTAGEQRLQQFVEAVEKDEPLDDVLLRELAADFRQLLGGEDPKRALHLLKPRGRRADSLNTGLRKVGLVLLVIRQMQSGQSKATALESVSNDHHVAYRTLQRYYDDHHQHARQLSTAIDRLNTTAAQAAPTITRFAEAARRLWDLLRRQK